MNKTKTKQLRTDKKQLQDLLLLNDTQNFTKSAANEPIKTE